VSSTAYQKSLKMQPNNGILNPLCIELIADDYFYGSDMHKLHSGRHTGAFRGICAISVALTGHPAKTKSQFGAFSPATRPPFQRKYCKLCSNCSNNCNICNILNF